MDIYLAASRLGEYPFSSQMEAIVFIILQTFLATCTVLKIGKYSWIFPSFSWGMFWSHGGLDIQLMDYKQIKKDMIYSHG